MRSSTDHRAVRLQEGGEGKDQLEKEYLSLLAGTPIPNSDLVYANDIYHDSYKSEVLEAFFLAGASDIDVETTLRVPAAVSKVYRQLFWDYSVFRDELDIEAYTQTYEESAYGKEIKTCAVTLGLEYLQFRFGRGKNSDVSLTSALQSMIETGFMLSKAARINPLDSTASREARQWLTASIKGMESYAKVKAASGETIDDFKIALETIDHSTNEQKNPGIKKGEILH